MKQHLTYNTTKWSKKIKFNQLVFTFYGKEKETTESLALKVGCLFLMEKISHLSEKFIIIILNLQIT